jgi:mannosyltransferase
LRNEEVVKEAMRAEIPTSETWQNDDVLGMNRPARAVPIWPWVTASLLAAFYLATSVYIASHRLYWFDELFIVRIAQVRDVATMWRALGHAADTMPPGYHLLMRVLGKLFGYSEVATRLPSAVAMIAGLLLTYDCARRLTDGIHGLIALSLLTCSFLPYYGYEARPYAFYFMFSALAFWIWTCTRDDSKWSAFFFGVVLCLAVTMHYYAVLNIVPYALWEISRWKPWRRPSRKLIAGLLGVALPTVVLLPLAMSFARQFSRSFWAHPSFYELKAAFSELFPDGLFLLSVIIIWIALTSSAGKKSAAREMPSAESLGWLFLSIPMAGFVVAELKTNAFLTRYFIGALPGVAVAFSSWLWRHFHSAYRTSLGVLLLLAMWGAANQWTTVRHPESIDPFGQQTATRQYLKLEGALHSDGKRFILFHDSLLHLEAKHYSQHPDDIILLLEADGTEEAPSTQVQVNLSHYSPLQLWKLNDLKEHARETALVDPVPQTVEAMKQAGFQVAVRFSRPMEVVYFQ